MIDASKYPANHPIVSGFRKSKYNMICDGELVYIGEGRTGASYPHYSVRDKSLVWITYDFLNCTQISNSICLLDLLRDGLYELFGDCCDFFKIPLSERVAMYDMCGLSALSEKTVGVI